MKRQTNKVASKARSSPKVRAFSAVRAANSKQDTTQVKTLDPRTPCVQYTGQEPEWLQQPEESQRSILVTRALNWYNYHYSRKEARDLLAQWLEIQKRPEHAKAVRSAPDSAITTTVGWVARLNTRGLVLLPREVEYIERSINGILAESATGKEAAKETKEDAQKPNIQDRLREKIRECGGELEGMFDEFCSNGHKLADNFAPVEVLRSMNVAPQMVSELAKGWETRLQEFQELAQGNDDQLVEGYSHLKRTSVRNAIKFCEAVINACMSYVQIKKVERKPRAKKVIPPERRAAKFRCVRSIEDPKITGEQAVKLVNASEAWLYESKKRKLIHVVADEHAGTFTLKNNAIVGFDPSQTLQKTLRKPEESIAALMAAGKPAARKFFKEIRAVETKFNGKGTPNLVILRAW